MIKQPKIGDRIKCGNYEHGTYGKIGTATTDKLSLSGSNKFYVLWDFNNKVGWCCDKFEILNKEPDLFNGGIII
jgi:hypothetical protein